jgi:lysophospholipase L1-like esterase/regulation of enolase protein 1 (concanavalin A-like superfamily)
MTLKTLFIRFRPIFSIWMSLGFLFAVSPNSSGQVSPPLSSEVVGTDTLKDHASALLELPNGDLFCMWYRRDFDRVSDSFLATSRLPLGSTTWTTPVNAISTPNRGHGNPVLYLDDENVIWCFYSVKNEDWLIYKNDGVTLDDSSIWNANLYYRKSYNYGQSWSAPVLVRGTMNRFISGQSNGWLAGCKPIMADNGRIIVPVYRDFYTTQISPLKYIYKDRSDAVWLSVDPAGETIADSNAVFKAPWSTMPTSQRLANGQLLNFLRTPNSTSSGKVWKTTGSPSGLSYPDPVISDPVCSQARLDLLRLENGNLYMVHNNPNRLNMGITRSTDGGSTWQTYKLVEQISGDPSNNGLHLAYPAIIQTLDGLIHVSYSFNGYKGIRHVVVSEPWYSGQATSYRPNVGITSPKQGDYFTNGSVTIQANAVDKDGSVSKVEFFLNGTSIGQDTSAPYSLTYTFPAGTNVVTAKATDNGGNTLTSRAIKFHVASSAGSLSGSLSTTVGSLDVASGSQDWIVWGNGGTATNTVRKSGSAYLGDLRTFGQTSLIPYTGAATLSWSGGSPTATGSSSQGRAIQYTGSGFELTVPADTTQRTLKLYVGTYKSKVQIEAWLSDNSAPRYFDSDFSNSSGLQNGVYTFNFKAGRANQTLTVRFLNGHNFGSNSVSDSGWGGPAASNVGYVGMQGAVLTGPSAPSVPVWPTNAKIMALGDSITEGNAVDGGYRKPLQSLLNNAGLTYNFVGSQTANSEGMSDPEHEGYPGKRSDEVNALAKPKYTTYTPDIYLVHVGTNDITQGQSSSIVGRVRTILTDIYAATPNATVLLAKIIPRKTPSSPTTTTASQQRAVVTFNNQIDAIVASYSLNGKRVFAVDQHALISDNEMNDEDHPNQSGFNKMAEAWFQALRKAYSVAGGGSAGGGGNQQPPSFTGYNIGGATGSLNAQANGEYQVTGSGIGPDSNADVLHFEAEQRSGDFEVSVRVKSLTGGRAGLMIRETNDGNAKFAAINSTSGTSYGGGIRAVTNDGFLGLGFGSYTYPNAWMKLKRHGSTITFYTSSDGVNFTLVDTRTISFASTVYVGLFVSSGGTGTATAVFADYKRSWAVTAVPARMLHVYTASFNGTAKQSTPTTSLDGVNIKSSGTDARYAYLRFNVTGLTGLTVNSVRLRLKEGTAGSAGNTTFEVRKVTSSIVTPLTWNNKPASGTTVFGSGGGQLTENQVIEIPLTSFLTGDGTYEIVLLPTGGTKDTEFARIVDGSGVAPALLVETNENSYAATLDNHVKQDQPSATAGNVNVKFSSTAARYAYLRFSINGLSGTQIRSVKLYLKEGVAGSAGNAVFEVRKTTGAWPATMTWNSKPSVGATSFGSGGGALTENQWTSVNLSNSFYTGDGTYEIALIPTSGAKDSEFQSQENGDSDVAKIVIAADQP